MTRLHREPIVDREDAPPPRWLLLTHGIYGSGGNLRSVARQLVRRRPAWGVLLVDLRGHGRSDDGAPPHDLAACAGDVRALVDEVRADHPVHAIAGHSFGGKVMLEVRAAWPGTPPLAQTWVLDATPAARPGALDDPDNSVRQVLDLLASLPPRWASRDEFVAAVAASPVAGPTIGQWLATSLVHDGDGYRLRLVPAQLRELLADYYARDLWSAVEDPALPGEVRFLVAARADVVAAGDRARAAAAPRTTVELVDAGHWLHAEAPGAVVDAFARGLPA